MGIQQQSNKKAIRKTKFPWGKEEVLVKISDCLKGEKETESLIKFFGSRISLGYLNKLWFGPKLLFKWKQADAREPSNLLTSCGNGRGNAVSLHVQWYVCGKKAFTTDKKYVFWYHH